MNKRGEIEYQEQLTTAPGGTGCIKRPDRVELKDSHSEVAGQQASEGVYS